MKRQQLLNLLEAYQPTPEEMQDKKEMITFIQEHEDCFERSLQEGHVTASAWILSKDHSHALLLHHKKLNDWFQLGGHCDGNPDVLAVAIKEAQEESGIMGIEPVEVEPTTSSRAIRSERGDPVNEKNSIFDIDIHWIPERKNEKGHWHYDVRFLLHVVTDEQVVQNHESNELRWVSKDLCDLPTTAPSVTRMFHKWLSCADHRSDLIAL